MCNKNDYYLVSPKDEWVKNVRTNDLCTIQDLRNKYSRIMPDVQVVKNDGLHIFANGLRFFNGELYHYEGK